MNFRKESCSAFPFSSLLPSNEFPRGLCLHSEAVTDIPRASAFLSGFRTSKDALFLPLVPWLQIWDLAGPFRGLGSLQVSFQWSVFGVRVESAWVSLILPGFNSLLSPSQHYSTSILAAAAAAVSTSDDQELLHSRFFPYTSSQMFLDQLNTGGSATLPATNGSNSGSNSSLVSSTSIREAHGHPVASRSNTDPTSLFGVIPDIISLDWAWLRCLWTRGWRDLQFCFTLFLFRNADKIFLFCREKKDVYREQNYIFSCTFVYKPKVIWVAKNKQKNYKSSQHHCLGFGRLSPSLFVLGLFWSFDSEPHNFLFVHSRANGENGALETLNIIEDFWFLRKQTASTLIGENFSFLRIGCIGKVSLHKCFESDSMFAIESDLPAFLLCLFILKWDGGTFSYRNSIAFSRVSWR